MTGKTQHLNVNKPIVSRKNTVTLATLAKAKDVDYKKV